MLQDMPQVEHSHRMHTIPLASSKPERFPYHNLRKSLCESCGPLLGATTGEKARFSINIPRWTQANLTLDELLALGGSLARDKLQR